MDRFFDEEHIVKKQTTIQNVLTRANQLKQQTQQKLEKLTPEQLESIQQIDGQISNRKIVKSILEHAQNINLPETNMIDINNNLQNNINENNNLKNDNIINTNLQNTININDNLHNNIDINKEKVIFDATQQLKTNNYTQANFDNSISEKNNIQEQKNKNEITDKNEIINQKDTIDKDNTKPNERNVNENIRKEILKTEKIYKPAEILIKKQIQAYNDLVNYQVELEIVNRMSIRVEEKLRKSYNTRIYGLQSQIREQEIRLGVIADLLAGK